MRICPHSLHNATMFRMEAPMLIDTATIGLRALHQNERGRADDYANILQAENAMDGSGWMYEDLVKFMQHPRAHAEIAEAYKVRKGRNPTLYVVGHVLYVANACNIQLVSVAVHEDCREQGVGRQILHHMERKLTGKVIEMYGDVDAGNMAACKWLRSCGLKRSKCVYVGKERREYIRFSMDMTEVAMGCL